MNWECGRAGGFSTLQEVGVLDVCADSTDCEARYDYGGDGLWWVLDVCADSTDCEGVMVGQHRAEDQEPACAFSINCAGRT